MKDIINLLLKIESDSFFPTNPKINLDLTRLPVPPVGPEIFTAEQFSQLENKLNVSLPSEYQLLMKEFGVFSLDSDDGEEEYHNILMYEFKPMLNDAYSSIT